MADKRAVLYDARLMQHAEGVRNLEVNEILDRTTMPATIGDLRKLLLWSYEKGFSTCAGLAAEKVKEWKEPSEGEAENGLARSAISGEGNTKVTYGMDEN